MNRDTFEYLRKSKLIQFISTKITSVPVENVLEMGRMESESPAAEFQMELMRPDHPAGHGEMK